MNKVSIAVLIGNGSKLPAIIHASKAKNSNFYISLIVSHKKESSGVLTGLDNKIPSVYFNLPDFRKNFLKSQKNVRQNYSKFLGWFVSQRNYDPKLLVFAGWDLILGPSFFNFFKSNLGDGYAAINIHPAIMPINNEKRFIKLPDGTDTPLIKGEQQEVLKTILVKKFTYFGPSIHFMNPKKYDTGTVIERKFIKVGNAQNVEQLKAKLMSVEDRLLVKSIKTVCKKIS